MDSLGLLFCPNILLLKNGDTDMPHEDIKEGYTLFKIRGTEYKIAFDHSAILKLEELFGGYIDIADKMQSGEFKFLKERLEICRIGFLKYHPELTTDIIGQAENYDELWSAVCLEFFRKIKSPEMYQGLVLVAEETKKKINELNEQRLSGNTTSQDGSASQKLSCV